MKEPQDDSTEPDSQEKPNRRPLKKWLLPWILFALLLASAGGIYWWFFMYGRISTDDAYVKAHSASISSRIWGTVVDVQVDNDDTVKE